MINLVIADDHDVIRNGLKILLGSDEEITITGDAATGKEVINLLNENTSVDVVIMDIGMPELNGIDACKYIHVNHPEVKVLALTMYQDEAQVTDMLKAGAAGYITKAADCTTLIKAIKTVYQGTTYLDQEIATALFTGSFNKYKRNPEPMPENKILSVQEVEILGLIAEGLTNQEIADKIFISKRTVETHRQNLILKTNCKNTPALIKYALQHNILPIH